MSERKKISTSIDAYKSLQPTEVAEIYLKIMSTLAIIGEGTFEEIAAHAKVDKSRVWKRMSELERMEKVYRPGNKRPLRSGRSGFTWMLTNQAVPKTEKQQVELTQISNKVVQQKINKLPDETKPKYVQQSLL